MQPAGVMTLGTCCLTSEIFFPGLMSRMAASRAVLAAAITSAVLPVTAASSSACTTSVCAAVVTKPSMCAPRSLQDKL